MKIRPITQKELEKFASIGNDPDSFKNRLDKMCEKGVSKPEWCFVHDDEGEFKAWIAYGNNPAWGEFFIFGLHLTWDENFLANGKELLEYSLDKIYQIDETKSIFADVSSVFEHKEKNMKVYEEAAFTLIQEKMHFIFDNNHRLPILGSRLTFKNLNETGKEAFIKAIEIVSRQTLDRLDKYEIETKGPQKAAKRYFDALERIEMNPERWLLAYDPESGGFVGLVIVQKHDPASGMINYIGVAPEHRGRGYIDDLLAKGTSELLKAGYKSVIGEIDPLNYPVKKALFYMGFKKTTTTWWYHKVF